jgi:hypothetical protein
LTVNAGCGVANFQRAVIVDGGAFDDGMNDVTVGKRCIVALPSNARWSEPDVKRLGLTRL